MLSRRFILCGFLALCQPTWGLAQDTSTIPAARGDGWPVAAPGKIGLDPQALAELVELIDAGVSYPNIHALLIEHDGRLIFEHYWPGEDYNWIDPLGRVDHGPETLHDLRSVSKSVTALLLGIALGADPKDALARPIAQFFPDQNGLDPALGAVTLHHVLTMTAGLAWNETIVSYDDPRNDFIRLIASDDPASFVLRKERRHAPGSQWNYNSGLTDLTAGVIEHLTGRPLTDYAEHVLFDPLGITDYEWRRPAAWGPNGFPNASAGLRLRAPDLAKIGALILHEGKWQGRQIVPAPWIETATARHVDAPWGRYGYGYFWWPGKLVSGHAVIRAAGSGDQRIYVLPERRLVVTLLAGNYGDASTEVGARIMGRIVRALP